MKLQYMLNISMNSVNPFQMNVYSLTKHIKNCVTSGNDTNISHGGLEINKSYCRI